MSVTRTTIEETMRKLEAGDWEAVGAIDQYGMVAVRNLRPARASPSASSTTSTCRMANLPGQRSKRDQPMTDDNKTTRQPAPFKSCEEMTPEERDARNEAAFTWKEARCR